MEADLMTEERYRMLLSKIDALTKMVATLELRRANEQLLDSDAFQRLLGVSPTNERVWRENGMISYAEVDGRVYYRMQDIEIFLMAHTKKATQKGYLG
jgi:hypothetical protein